MPQLTEADKRAQQTRIVIKTVMGGIVVAIVVILFYIVSHLYEMLG